ncbi:MAG: phosphoenolpyruvate synthase [Spirochaetes bacterium]|jgi:CheY-like chemotaxis protein|nr:phosphoenolpyruvate synthase [Spirochaetota bacterium]
MHGFPGEEREYGFTETPVKLLMQRRIEDVLLVCSKYDRFMLEEDGRVDEQIFQEYVSLNLRYPPKFTQVYTEADAFALLGDQHFDLVISMLNMGGPDAVQLAENVCSRYPELPVVLLTPASRGTTLQITQSQRGRGIQQFAWLGDDSILLALVKLIEDRMNVDADVASAGVQVIVLVEDSVRFYSSYLPVIYRVLFQQARNLMEEGLNEWEQTMRMRCRPKILLANTYEEAVSLCDRYRDNLLGIISDVSYERDGEEDPQAGLELCRHIRQRGEAIPVLLQSSERKHRRDAAACGAGYLYKNSKKLLYNLSRYIREQYGFGDFLFRDPATGAVVEHASDLRDLQHKITSVPNDSLLHHAARNDISRWLRARALFSLADVSARITLDPDLVEESKEEVYKLFGAYRRFESRGKIARFERERYDEYASFSRIGEGSLGGKGRGLAFIDHSLKEHRMRDSYDGIVISVPQTVVLGTDVFQRFVESNNLVDLLTMGEPSDQEILDRFVEAVFSEEIVEDLRTVLRVMTSPIAVRSSSMLEDSGYQPFAGIYKTYHLANNADTVEARLADLLRAIKSVYASTYYAASRDYMAAVNSLVTEERMAVIVQEVTGTVYENRCFPSISGVARSVNFYAFEHEKPEEGVAYAAVGLGRTVVEGMNCLRFSPAHPKRALQLSDVDGALRTTQKAFYTLDMHGGPFSPSMDEASVLELCDISEIEEDPSKALLVSTYDHGNGMLRDGWSTNGRLTVTLAGVLKHGAFPLAAILRDLLDLAKSEMGVPVEIEYAVDMNPADGSPIVFSFLQLRPIVEGFEAEDVAVDTVPEETVIARSNTALGNGVYDDLSFAVYVKPDAFDAAKTETIAMRIESANDKVAAADGHYLLVAPGRLGSRDPWLGIPVAWNQISRAQVICELELEGFDVDPSQGSHFFHNLTALKLGYLTISRGDDDFLDTSSLDAAPTVYEDEFLRLVDLREAPLEARIDGRSRRAVISRKVYSSVWVQSAEENRA